MRNSDWKAEFSIIEDLYQRALYSGALIAPHERLNLAIAFDQGVERFRAGGKQAEEVLEEKLRAGIASAAIILIRIGDLPKLAHLSRAATELDRFHLPATILKQLWTISPPADGVGLFRQWTSRLIYERLPLLEALLAHPTQNAYALFKQVINSGVTRPLGHDAIRMVAQWRDAELLKEVIENPPKVIHQEWEEPDLSLEAALHLGLMGDPMGVSFLTNVANSQADFQAAQACWRLALLAHPNAVTPTQRLLEHEDGNIVSIVLNAASRLRSAELILPLLKLAEQEIDADELSVPLGDEAIRVVRECFEPVLCAPLDEEYAMDQVEAFTGEFRQKAVRHYRQALPKLIEKRRYHHGELLTLQHLADELLSPHWGLTVGGAHNLQAITGENYGFDTSPHANLITNLPAVLAWRKRVENSEPLVPGTWAYQGHPVQY